MKFKISFLLLLVFALCFIFYPKEQTSHLANISKEKPQDFDVQISETFSEVFSKVLEKKESSIKQTFESFLRVQEIELKNEKQKEQYEAYLEDTALLNMAEQKLLSFGKTFDSKEEDERLLLVGYLSDALAFEKHSKKEDLKSTVLKLIEDKSYFDLQDIKQKKSVAGDRLELFMALLDSDKALAEELIAKHQDSPLKGLLDLGLRITSVKS